MPNTGLYTFNSAEAMGSVLPRATALPRESTVMAVECAMGLAGQFWAEGRARVILETGLGQEAQIQTLREFRVLGLEPSLIYKGL